MYTCILLYFADKKFRFQEVEWFVTFAGLVRVSWAWNSGFLTLCLALFQAFLQLEGLTSALYLLKNSKELRAILSFNSISICLASYLLIWFCLLAWHFSRGGYISVNNLCYVTTTQNSVTLRPPPFCYSSFFGRVWISISWVVLGPCITHLMQSGGSTLRVGNPKWPHSCLAVGTGCRLNLFLCVCSPSRRLVQGFFGRNNSWIRKDPLHCHFVKSLRVTFFGLLLVKQVTRAWLLRHMIH